MPDMKAQDIQLVGTFSSKVKYFPWQSWAEWSSVCDQIIHLKQRAMSISETRECLTTLTKWLAKNTSVVSSGQNASAHSKYLKMQKILFQDKIAVQKKEEGLLSSNLRLIQLVEMGASTSKYRKSKSGGRLAMKNIAEELNFPKSLVSLRH